MWWIVQNAKKVIQVIRAFIKMKQKSKNNNEIYLEQR